MKISLLKNGLLGLNQGENFQSAYQNAKAAVIPFDLEKTVSYGRGAKNGPKAIIAASHFMEVMDEQTGKLFCKCGIATLAEPKMPKDHRAALELLAKLVKKVIDDKKFPVILGGEHSITQGALKGLCSKYKNFTILHFDAHSDTRQNYFLGGPFSHGAVMSQVLKKFPVTKLVQVGVRSVSDRDGEPAFRKKFRQKIKTFWIWDKFSPADVVRAIPTRDVYISFDVDAFDPAIMPATGTPEPGGLLWWQTIDILRAVYRSKNVIGADVVELAPIKGLHHPDFMVAKLVYKLIGYKFY